MYEFVHAQHLMKTHLNTALLIEELSFKRSLSGPTQCCVCAHTLFKWSSAANDVMLHPASVCLSVCLSVRQRPHKT